jgi:hypothetical protein
MASLGFRGGGGARDTDAEAATPAELKDRAGREFMPAIIVHGGAGWISDERAAVCIAGVERAAKVGYAVLIAGGSSMDAVEAAVRYV